MTTGIVDAALDFAKAHYVGKDPSNEMYRVSPVTKIALLIAEKEGIEDLDIVRLGVILHHIRDCKYPGNPDEQPGVVAHRFLKSHGYPEEKNKKVVNIVLGVGSKNEVYGSKVQVLPELVVVQDANILYDIGENVIGTINAAHAFLFGALGQPVGLGVLYLGLDNMNPG